MPESISWKRVRRAARGAVVLAALTLAALSVGCKPGTHAAPGASSAQPQSALTSQAGPPGPPPVELTTVKNRFCRGQAPQGWNITDQDNVGAAFTLSSPDGSMAAGYGNEPVGAALRAGGAAAMARLHAIAPYLNPPQLSPEQLGAQYATPISTVEYTLRQLFGPSTQFSGSASNTSTAYQLLKFSGGGRRGLVIFRVFTDSEGDQSIILRIAAVSPDHSDKDLAETAAVVTSINCLQVAKPPPPPPAPADYQGAKPDSDSASQKCAVWSPSCDDSDFAGTYNAQLGTGWVHSSSGTNYLVDADSDKWETGPDGSGFYIRHANGNVEKLQPGLDDSN